MADKRSSGRPVGKDSTQVRETYINKARASFTEYGYSAASMSNIAKDAGYTPTALRHYFSDKTELYSAVFAATANEVYPQIVQHLYSSTMAEAIEGSMTRMFQISKDFPTHTHFLSRVPAELRKHPELKERVEVRENFTEFFYSSLIALGRKTGEIESLTDEFNIKFFRIAMQGWIYEGHYSRNVNLTTQIALVKLLQNL
tara:strand:+ start:3450 stop:4049 length:600 start_codon:yes stop_codon:yes gene_type:complete